jgi:putative membrane protein
MAHPQLETHYAWIRTRLSLENTLMGWIRTTTSLIGFGFTIYQFFDKFQANATTQVARPDAPRNLGLSLIGVGVLALAFAIWRYHETLRELAEAEFADVAIERSSRLRGWRSPYVVAGLLLVIGIVTFFWILVGA